MFKKLKFWFDFIKRVIEGYEETVSNHGFSPLNTKPTKSRSTNVQPNKAK